MFPETAVAIIDSLLIEAHKSHTSDIHLDPESDFLLARYRIDGALSDVHQLPKNLHSEIIARLKILGGLRIDEHQQPQDGRFRFPIDSKNTIDVRISIAPTYHGENAVLRLLYPFHALSDLSLLGFSEEHQRLVRQAIDQPHGMILLSGPTGSGKTSTLYAFLHLLNTRTTSIITIEDPVEYAIRGIMQISAGKQYGISFADGLRSILRQDPDVIGIGEIRDAETAALASHAALTGHRVLSTLHARDAVSTIPRLLNMGVEPYVLSTTISAIINQRLVRKQCAECAERMEEPPTKNCDTCRGTGFTGRSGVFEVLLLNSAISEAIRSKASANELFTLARASGMQTMLEDGLDKAARGIVLIEDVFALSASNHIS